jgi:F-type H+-transporting ATPase subunit gamma
MANVKDLKVRIKSTKSTFKITSAMKLVSAAKLARAQQNIVGLKPYSNELEETVRTVSVLAEGYEHNYFKTNENNKAILLVISSDKGLCGGYNTGLSKKVRAFLAENSQLDFKVCFIGKKVKELISKEVNTGKHYTFEKAEPNFEEIKEIADEFAHMFETAEIGKVYVAFQGFKSVIETIPTVKKILPLTTSDEVKEELESKFPFDFKYDPSPEAILESLIPQVFTNSIHTSVLDAIASEHGSRMSAMENATKNCKEMIKNLTLKMNKLRQAAITTELIEVISGAESLKS